MRTSHFSPNEYGHYIAIGPMGTRYGLIGHDSRDVWGWMEAHPDFEGTIYFDLGDGGDQTEVTEFFIADPIPTDLAEDMGVEIGEGEIA